MRGVLNHSGDGVQGKQPEVFVKSSPCGFVAELILRTVEYSKNRASRILRHPVVVGTTFCRG